MRGMGEYCLFFFPFPGFVKEVSWWLTEICRIAYMINENSIQFNVVSKGLGCERMSFYLNEAAGDIRDLMLQTLETPKAKL